jgi:hypothetical protein
MLIRPLAVAASALALVACSSPGRNGNGNGNGGSPDMGSPLQSCAGVALEADGVLDVDVRSVRVSGRVTLAGGLLPDEGAALRFVQKRSGFSTTVELPQGGDYEIVLSPGTYDVWWSEGTRTCRGRRTPCVDGVLRANVAIADDGTLDLDVVPIAIQGLVSLNGAALPVDAQGSVSFALDGGGRASEPLEAGGAYEVVLLPGSYRIGVETTESCETSILPCTTSIVHRDRALMQSGVLDLDVRAITITGRVTVKQQSWRSTAQASIEFVQTIDDASKETTRATRPVASDGRYSVVLSPGTYDVVYAGQSSRCDAATESAPCNRGTLLRQKVLAPRRRRVPVGSRARQRHLRAPR